VVEAVIALSASPNGFTASDIAARLRQRCPPYGPRHAAYDLKKLRSKHIVCRIGHARRYEPLANGLRAIAGIMYQTHLSHL
jgi:repressor of nif and glnA expression